MQPVPTTPATPTGNPDSCLPLLTTVPVYAPSTPTLPPNRPATTNSHAQFTTNLASTDNNQSQSITNALESSPSLPFTWSESMNGIDFTQAISAAYEEVVHWHHNLFPPPLRRTGKLFTSELARLYRAYGEGSALEPIALNAAMTMPALLLQKPRTNSKLREHTDCLQRRLIAWMKGDINNLIIEGRTIQHRLKQKYNTTDSDNEKITRSFTKLMFQGKVKSALRLLSETRKGSPLRIDMLLASGEETTSTVRDEQLKKHPSGQTASPEALLQPHSLLPPPNHPVIFEHIDAASIRSAALRTNGSAGPSGPDTSSWRHLCTSFHSTSNELCNSLELVAKKICTSHVDPYGLAPFTACRLIALDKCPGVRPIGVCETVCRIIGKSILSTIETDIQEAAGTLQLCAGQEAGCEAAIHAMQQIFKDEHTEAVLLVDASNAFNNLNRQAALHNIHILCPPLATILSNTYQADVQLFIDGETLYSREGTTQGDPLAMAMYGIGILPLIHQLTPMNVKKVWYVDDASAGGKISNLLNWWNAVCNKGPGYGYTVNPKKTWLIVKEEHHSAAVDAFDNTGVQITTKGRTHLGAPLGSKYFSDKWITDKVDGWATTIKKLSKIALTQPQVLPMQPLHMAWPANGSSFYIPAPSPPTSYNPSKRPSISTSSQYSWEEATSASKKKTSSHFQQDWVAWAFQNQLT